MMKLFLMLILSSLMFIITSHPLTMAIILMMNTLFMSLITGLFNLNYWYSFMLFMIMIGGMLVLIMYMTTVASNEQMENLLKFLPLISFMAVTLCLPDLFSMNVHVNTFDTNYMNIKNNLSLSKFISPEHLPLIILMINYLLITLIAIVKITSLKQGSLRQKF